MGLAPKYFVYALVDPRDCAIRYIGKSCGGMSVPRRHGKLFDMAHSHNPSKNSWLLSLVALQQTPTIELLEVFESNDGLGLAEREWIAEHRRHGVSLLNICEGGEHEPGYKWSAEQRAKIKGRLKGRRLSEETKRRMSEGRKGIPSATGRKHSLKSRIKMSLANLGRPVAESTKEKLRNRIVSDVTKEKIRIARLGKPLSEFHRERISIGLHAHHSRGAGGT